MADPQPNSRAAATPEFLLDEADLLTADEELALEAEVAEPEPEGLPAKLPPKAPEPEPAQQQATTPEVPPKKAPPKAIPYERFKEVNDKAKTLEDQLTAEREKGARLDERIKMARESEERAAAQARQQPAPEAPTKLGARPDPGIDPIGADIWDVRRENEVLAHKLEQNQAAVGQTSQQMQIDRQQQEFAGWVNNDARQFRAQHADYDQATAHVYQFRVNYWTSLGLDEDKARAIVDQEAVASANLARQNGKSAAAGFYELARQVGYNGNGAQSATQAATPEVLPSPTQAARERLNQVRNGQKFQGLSRVPAEKSDNLDWSSMSAQDLADYPEDQLAEDLNDPVKGPMLRKVYARLELGQ